MKHINIFQGNKVTLLDEIVYESGIEDTIGIALAVIRESEPHYHNETTEWYLVIKGNAMVFLDEKEVPIKEYDVLEIPPKTVHCIKANGKIEVWAISSPPWKQEDHYKVEK